ncbi:hypothetical protein GCM10020218_050230 [Dactylosporangium vinaceum]
MTSSVSFDAAPGGNRAAMATNDNAILVGGPRDGATIEAGDAPVLEFEIDGYLHRYIHTTKQRDSYDVYNYDGEIDPNGAMPGAETPEPREQA